jgi:hypothetical protein
MASSIGLETLVLNADYQPLDRLDISGIPVESAIRSVYNDLSVVVDTYDRIVKTSQVKYRVPFPSVIAVKTYVEKPVTANVNDNNLLIRDGFECVYCGMPLNTKNLTWDHYVPQSRGGGNEWTNILSSCHDCNNALGDVEAKYKKPKHKPFAPSHGLLARLRRRYPVTVGHKSWLPWIGEWESDIHIKVNN